MPELANTRRDDRPTEGFSTTHLSSDLNRPVRLFLPADYQPKYAYPLVVVFHPEGGDEDAAARLVPALSRRNYIAACPRGSVRLGLAPNGRPGFGWGHREPSEFLIETVAHACREYHVHAERIYFVGVGTGAEAAYRLGITLSAEAAGVVALNGRLPADNDLAPARPKAAKRLRFFIGHGSSNPVIPVAAARRDTRLLSATGAEVQLNTYPTTNRLHPDMFRDVNRWIMGAVNTDPEAFATPVLG
jgi:phospholipase/carboxylesterase